MRSHAKHFESMINGLLIFSESKKTRVFRLNSQLKNPGHFVRSAMESVLSLQSGPNTVQDSGVTELSEKDFLIVYRKVGVLYFCFIIEHTLSVLVALDLVHVYVNALQKVLTNLSEVEVMTKSYQCEYVFGQMVQEGHIIETSGEAIVELARTGLQVMHGEDQASSFGSFRAAVVEGASNVAQGIFRR